MLIIAKLLSMLKKTKDFLWLMVGIAMVIVGTVITTFLAYAEWARHIKEEEEGRK